VFADIARAAALLASAQRPVLVLGGCAAQHQPHDALASAVRRLGIPAFTNGHARGVVADDGALVLGHASPLFNGAFRIAADADLWLVGGAAIDYNIASVVAPGASVIQVHRDARQLAVGRVPTLGVEGDTAATLTALADAAPSQARWSAWLEACRARYRAQHAGWSRTLAQARAQRGGIHPAALCEALSRYRTPGMTLVVDVGDFVNWPKAYFPALAPARYMDGGALGNLGGALPIALGAQLARPKDPVWAFTGDGGYGFHSWDLSLAVERKLPLKVIVGNDAAWGTEKRLQCAAYGRDIACELPAIRYDRHAELLGLLAFHAETTGELESIVADFVSASGPCLLDITLAPQAGRPYASGAA
jgi:acetolactate synthase-1/2/3 large subunit